MVIPPIPSIKRISNYIPFINFLKNASALILLISTLGCSSSETPYTRETYVMGTQASVIIHGLEDSLAERISSEALGELHRIESVMSNWNEHSEISNLNRHSGNGPYKVSKELLYIISEAKYYSLLTSGAFDVTTGPLVKLWGFHGGKPNLPPGSEIDEALNRVGCSHILLDQQAGTVELKEGTEIDLAGIAKGYAVDRCMDVLEAGGARTALVNLGGNIKAIGKPPGKEGWIVGLRDPYGGNSVVGSILICDQAVATSGNYENFIEIEGKRYGHIIDPRTGYPVSDVLSVTVLAQSALAADALSTGLFVLGPSQTEGINLTQKHELKALFAIDEREGLKFNKIGEFEERLKLFKPQDLKD
jgi:thiamine biosynthesis lipoprotein